MRILAFEGKHKIADRWESEPYMVVDQPTPGIPVYVLKPEKGQGRQRTLHRNNLLPIGSIPWEEAKAVSPEVSTERPRPKPHKPRSKPVPPVPEVEVEVDTSSEDEYVMMYPLVEAEGGNEGEDHSSSGTDQEDEEVIEDPQGTLPLRRSCRERRPPTRYKDYVMSHQRKPPTPAVRKKIAGHLHIKWFRCWTK